eukprot:1632319-Pleurochrysis_carterae.AAC.1
MDGGGTGGCHAWKECTGLSGRGWMRGWHKGNFVSCPKPRQPRCAVRYKSSRLSKAAGRRVPRLTRPDL